MASAIRATETVSWCDEAKKSVDEKDVPDSGLNNTLRVNNNENANPFKTFLFTLKLFRKNKTGIFYLVYQSSKIVLNFLKKTDPFVNEF